MPYSMQLLSYVCVYTLSAYYKNGKWEIGTGMGEKEQNMLFLVCWAIRIRDMGRDWILWRMHMLEGALEV